MRKRAGDLAEMLRRDSTYIYLCGLRAMEPGVDQSLEEICTGNGLDWPSLKARMREEGRYHVETF
jgi:benzoyl-CoA 2,3-dioxygenase component A